MIVTFIYHVGKLTYYGKYIGSITDNYEEGLDIEIQNIIYPYVKEYYQLADPSQLNIGILFYQKDSYAYFSPKEANVFQFLLCDFYQGKELYLDGVKQSLV